MGSMPAGGSPQDAELLGRQEELDLLVPGGAGNLTVIVGDSGTGKSALLAATQKKSLDAIAPVPVQVRRAPGSLQMALVESLAEAVAILLAEQGATERLRGVLSRAIEKLAEAGPREIRRAVGQQLLGLLRNKVSGEAAELVEATFSAVSESLSESLARRLAEGGGSDVLREFLDLLREVEVAAEGKKVVLALDDLDRLSEDDLRALADLADRMPPGISLRGSFAVTGEVGQRQATDLAIAGANILEITGLANDDVVTWLLESGVDVQLLTGVVRATNGYPVHIQDALRLLDSDPSGVGLSTMQPNQITVARASQSWGELDLEEQVSLSKLAAYDERIDTARICALLGIDELTWGAVEIRLRKAGIIVGDANAWFHELRRRAIWDHVMTPAMRKSSIEAATNELEERLALPAATANDFVDFARIASMNRQALAEDSNLAAAAALSNSELAVLGAALELIEFDHGEKFVEVESALRHAQSVFGLVSGSLQALETLEDRGLLYVASDQHTSILTPIVSNERVFNMIVGRISATLGRTPVLQIATAVFRSRLGACIDGFADASYGVGEVTALEQSKHARSLRNRSVDGVVRIRSGMPSVSLRARLGEVPLFMTATFEDAGLRDAASEQLSKIEGPLFEHPLVVERILDMPADRIPPLRFATALEWLGIRIGFSTHMMTSVRPQEPLAVKERAAQTVRLRQAIAERCSPLELMVYGLDEPVGYAYGELDGQDLLAELRGESGLFEIPPGSIPDKIFGPYSRIEIESSLGLEGRARIGGMTLGTYALDPVSDLIVRLSRVASAFNDEQERTRIPLDEGSLEASISTARELRELDAEAILASIPGETVQMPVKTTTYVAISLAEPASRNALSGDSYVAATLPRRDEQLPVRLRINGSSFGQSSDAETMRSLFGIEFDEALHRSWGTATNFLAESLGYRTSDVRFVLP